METNSPRVSSSCKIVSNTVPCRRFDIFNFLKQGFGFGLRRVCRVGDEVGARLGSRRGWFTVVWSRSWRRIRFERGLWILMKSGD
ncbi:hypothetical protein E2542_SST08135 [Spatholobus suberectus]|nr:hypothetical protein E2542_SST08135 [Spatholobus suberectus]